MLDIKFIREHPQAVKEGCKKKQVNVDIDKILAVDEKFREILGMIEHLRSDQNRLGKEDIEKAKELKRQIKELEPKLEDLEGGLNSLLIQIPNMPLESVPVGKDDSENIVLRSYGEKPKFDFEPKDHLDIGEALDIIDVKRAAKVAGSRFGYLKGDAALLEFALVQLAIKTAIEEGFTPVVPPVFMKTEMMQAMGYVDTPEDLAERYYFEKDSLFLVGTSEQSVGAMHAGEILNEKDLPKRYVAFSTCFREEAGSYGRDTKGILRVHQFDKVELLSFVHPDKSQEEHEALVALEEKIWQALEIPYQVVQLCTGDMGRPHASTIDIEAWMPGQEKYREVSSASNMTDYQARRLNTRFKNKDGKLEYVHMLNATGVPIGRAIIAILENYQQKDGTVKIPNVLQGYVGKDHIG
jgi:seryl-tRNA synthetase